jgi:hypothetical protein
VASVGRPSKISGLKPTLSSTMNNPSKFFLLVLLIYVCTRLLKRVGVQTSKVLTSKIHIRALSIGSSFGQNGVQMRKNSKNTSPTDSSNGQICQGNEQ